LNGSHRPQGLPRRSFGGAIVTMSPVLPTACDMFGPKDIVKDVGMDFVRRWVRRWMRVVLEGGWSAGTS
jgi:hypothetical protein